MADKQFLAFTEQSRPGQRTFQVFRTVSLDDDILKHFHAQLALLTGHCFDPRVLEPWHAYFREIDAQLASSAAVDLLQQLWHEARLQQNQRLNARRYTPLVETQDDELCADTREQFAILLADIVRRSGASPQELSKRAPAAGPSRIGRSQIYSMISGDRYPRRPEQVRSLSSVCGLPERQIMLVLKAWATLSNERPSKRPGTRR